MLQWQRDNSITIKDAKALPPEKLINKFVIGEFVDSRTPEYCQEYQKVIEKAQGK